MTAFLGYVLPYGQMSFWGATVITNLLSAIPVFGHDLVELILYFKFITITTLGLEFFIFIWIDFLTHCFLDFNDVHINTLNLFILPVLPTIGTLSPYAYKKDIKKVINKNL